MSLQQPIVIDIHGHYTTAPKALEDWRNRQIAGIKDSTLMPKAAELRISDDALRESIETNQLAKMRARLGSHDFQSAGQLHGASYW